MIQYVTTIENLFISVMVDGRYRAQIRRLSSFGGNTHKWYLFVNGHEIQYVNRKKVAGNLRHVKQCVENYFK